MADDVLSEFYNSLLDDEILKIVINSINEQSSDTEEDFELILENCLELIGKAK
jgi:hypothetical protein